METKEVNFGDIILVNFGSPDGSVQKGIRPALVVQNNMGNRYSSTIVTIPITTKIKKLGQPTHYVLKRSPRNGLKSVSMLLGEQTTTINKSSIIRKIGSLDAEDIEGAVSVYFSNLPREIFLDQRKPEHTFENALDIAQVTA